MRVALAVVSLFAAWVWQNARFSFGFALGWLCGLAYMIAMVWVAVR